MRHARFSPRGTIQPFAKWHEHFVRLGLNTKSIYLREGIRIGGNDLASVPYDSFIEILAAAEREYGPDFVTDIVAGKSVGDFDLVGYLFINAPTLGAGLAAVRDWLPAINSRSKIKLEATDQDVICKYLTPGMLPDRNAPAVELAIAAQIKGIRRYLGRRDWSPTAVFFEHAPRDNADALVQLFGKNTVFSQSYSGIRISAGLTNVSSPKADAELFDMLSRRCKPDTGCADDIVSAVARLVSDGVRSGRLSAEEIAFELAMSKRTLYRRLKEASSSLGEIRQATLMPIAKEQLSQNLDLSTIAYRLGYSDCRSFARAFKRATGLPPAEYRRRIARAEPDAATASSLPHEDHPHSSSDGLRFGVVGGQ